MPIYISDSEIDDYENFPFKELDFNSDLLINNLISKINSHNENDVVLTSKKRNKTTTKNVDEINFEKIQFGNDNALLLKITSFNSNLYGSFIEKGERIKLNKNDKIGSEHYYAIIYPHIYGIEKREYKWIILVYEDPNKENADITSAIKLVLKKVLDITPVNIKLPDLMNKLKYVKSADLSMKFVSVNFEDNEVDYNISGYEVKTKTTKISESSYRGVPIEKINDIIQNKSFTEDFQSRVLRIVKGKQELKIEEKIDEENDKLKELAEELFNYKTEISVLDAETDVIYNTEYIIKKMEPVLRNYLNSFLDE